MTQHLRRTVLEKRRVFAGLTVPQAASVLDPAWACWGIAPGPWNREELSQVSWTGDGTDFRHWRNREESY